MTIFRRRTRPAEGNAEDVIVPIDVGFDRFHAHLLLEACRAEGCSVELLTMDDNGQAPGLPALLPHRLLARDSEIETVRRVIARTRPTTPGW
jgi:hypothetical protein